MNSFTYLYLTVKNFIQSHIDKIVEASWNRSTRKVELEARKNNKDSIISSTLTNMYNNSASVFASAGNGPLQPITLGTVGGGGIIKQGVISVNNEPTSLNFTVHTANGGKVVEYRPNLGNSKLYIIPEGADLGQEIGKIITLEILKA